MWPFAIRKSNNYGAYTVPGPEHKSVEAHNYVCTLVHGQRPSKTHEAAHSCCNRLCVNPKHLRWATRRANIVDSMQAGRMRGGGRYRQRLFAAERQYIRDSSKSLIELGNEFGMDPAYIGRVRRAERHA